MNMNKNITYNKRKVTLVGRKLKTQDFAPFCALVNPDMNKVRLSDFNGRIKVITTFMSLDSEICADQVLEFEKRAANILDDIAVIGISKDLPFAQKRFGTVHGIEKVELLSDYRRSSFGVNYGLLIKELDLLARALVVIDKNNTIRYIHVLDDAARSPDIHEWFNSIEKIIKTPAPEIKENAKPRCKPCEGGTPPLDGESIGKQLKTVSNWILDENKITRSFEFKNFKEAKYFVDLVAVIAEEQGHHPDLKLWYNKLQIELTTHAVGGLSANDFIMAGLIDELHQDA